jgi:hypothetical protein
MHTSLSLGLPLWAGVVLGVVVGWVSEWSTRLALQGVLSHRAAFLGSMMRWMALGFYLAKQAVLWLLVYVILSRLHFELLGFAAGILAYQLYRIVLMIFWPEVYLGQRYTT